MEQVISYLIAIERIAKGIHYETFGDKFYSDHLLADRIVDGLSDFVDEIFENWFMGKGDDVPQQNDVLRVATSLIPTIEGDLETDFDLLDRAIIQCLSLLEVEAKTNDELTVGDSDLLGRIGSDLQKKHGFVLKRLKK